jgi:hypothetical protein
MARMPLRRKTKGPCALGSPGGHAKSLSPRGLSGTILTSEKTKAILLSKARNNCYTHANVPL